jgi:DNA-binding transcriptional LysR family regulator
MTISMPRSSSQTASALQPQSSRTPWCGNQRPSLELKASSLKEPTDLSYDFHDFTNEENVAGLRDGRLNLASVIRPPKAAFLEGIRFVELIRERICLAVPPHHAFATRRSVSLADAVSEPFIGLTREEYPDYHISSP